MAEKLFNDRERDSRLAALYRAAGQDEPPPALDDAIRAAAHRAVTSRPRLAGSPFSHSWRLPLSIAAVVVLSVSLVTVMREEAPEILELPRADAPAPGSDRKPDPSAGDGTATVPTTVLAPDSAKSNSAGLKPPPPAASPNLGARTTAPPALASRPQQDDAASERTQSAPQLFSKRAPVDAFPGAADVRDKAVTPGEQPRQSLKEEARREVAASRAAEMRSTEMKRPAEAAADAAAQAKSQHQPEPAASSARGNMREPERARDQAPALPQSAPAAVAAPSPARAAQSVSKLARAMESDADLPPEKWLLRIEELRKQGKLEEARAGLTAFRKRYPDYPLPALLREWSER